MCFLLQMWKRKFKLFEDIVLFESFYAKNLAGSALNILVKYLSLMAGLT